MGEPRLIQQCVWIPEDDLYLISTHVHDFRTWTSKDRKDSYSVDGGCEYRRRLASSFQALEGIRVFEWSLTTDSPFGEVCEKLLWGSRGKNGDQPLSYRPISTLTLDHLRAILTTQPQIKGTIHERVIKHWIRKKSGKKT